MTSPAMLRFWRCCAPRVMSNKSAGSSADDFSPPMKQFFLSLPLNFIGCFKGRMIIWHLVAIILTFILVTSGFDWFYFSSTRSPALRSCMWPAVVIGRLIPLSLPLYLLLSGSLLQNARTTRIGWAIGQAALLGWFMAFLRSEEHT